MYWLINITQILRFNPKMSSKKPKDNNDLQLFREAMHDVAPITQDKVTHSSRKNSAKRQTATIEQQHHDKNRFSTEHVPDCDVILRFERPGLQKSTLKKLRQGKFPVEASLDLHGFTAEQARSALIEFLDYCQQSQYKVVCIVHGKGFGSSDKKPVIKPLVNKWLQEDNNVLAFSSAQPKDGGSGAVYLMLRRSD